MKKTLALILGLLMILALFAGCNGGESATPSATPAASTAPEGSQAPTEAPAEPGALALPIVDEKVTYTIWGGPMSTTAGMTSPNDSKAYQKAEELTNIHIEWNQPTTGQEQEQFNLIMASLNLPDIFFSGNAVGAGCYYIGGYDKFISDGIILDLSDLIEQYAPNYNALRTADDTVRRNTMTDSGNVPYFRTISPEREPSWIGVLARQDLLDKSGTGIVANNVQTYDEFHDMLAALKDYSNVAPYYMFTGKTGMEEFLMTGYGVISSYINRSGKAVFGPTDPGYLEYLTTMSNWYAEGLIDPEFYAAAGLFAGDLAKIYNSDYTAFQFFWTMPDMVDAQVTAGGSNMQGVSPPAKTKGDIRKLAYMSVPNTVLGGGNATITTNSEDIVPLVKWMDFFYSEEGAMLGNWGIEGESYVMGADGMPEWTELIYKNPDSLSVGDANSLWSIGPIHPKFYDWTRGRTPDMSERCLTIGTDIWDRNYQDNETMPEVAISVEESAEYAALMGDIKTFVEENTIKFIIGDKPLTEWDSFVTWINTHGIERCTEIQQAALDRYAKR